MAYGLLENGSTVDQNCAFPVDDAYVGGQKTSLYFRWHYWTTLSFQRITAISRVLESAADNKLFTVADVSPALKTSSRRRDPKQPLAILSQRFQYLVNGSNQISENGWDRQIHD